ncbi:MAG TPA: DUF4897 domain-containing protein [Bacteroidales bacterium]|nr:DUF4897 domain-containing protein [Bacteroidales bacterium]
MNNKKLMWILLLVIIAFAGFNIYTFFTNRQNYSQIEFAATYTFEKGLKTTIENSVLFGSEKVSDLENSMESFNSVPDAEKKENYREVLTQLEKNTDIPIGIDEYEAVAFMENGSLRIEEKSVISGMVKETDKGWITDFGTNRLELKENSNSKLIFIFPEDATLISVDPEPTERIGNVLTWKDIGEIQFPNIEYQ